MPGASVRSEQNQKRSQCGFGHYLSAGGKLKERFKTDFGKGTDLTVTDVRIESAFMVPDIGRLVDKSLFDRPMRFSTTGLSPVRQMEHSSCASRRRPSLSDSPFMIMPATGLSQSPGLMRFV